MSCFFMLHKPDKFKWNSVTLILKEHLFKEYQDAIIRVDWLAKIDALELHYFIQELSIIIVSVILMQADGRSRIL